MTAREKCNAILDTFTEDQLANVVRILQSVRNMIDVIYDDTFYSPENMARLRCSARRMDAGKGTEHELIEVDPEETKKYNSAF